MGRTNRKNSYIFTGQGQPSVLSFPLYLLQGFPDCSDRWCSGAQDIPLLNTGVLVRFLTRFRDFLRIFQSLCRDYKKAHLMQTSRYIISYPQQQAATKFGQMCMCYQARMGFFALFCQPKSRKLVILIFYSLSMMIFLKIPTPL